MPHGAIEITTMLCRRRERLAATGSGARRQAEGCQARRETSKSISDTTNARCDERGTVAGRPSCAAVPGSGPANRRAHAHDRRRQHPLFGGRTIHK